MKITKITNQSAIRNPQSSMEGADGMAIDDLMRRYEDLTKRAGDLRSYL